MKTEKSLPFFLTEVLGENAIDFALRAIRSMVKGKIIKRSDLHIVILVPELSTNKSGKYPSKYSLMPATLCEKSFGDKKKWEHSYDEIAQCEALQKWNDRNTNDNEATPAHLLFPNDTPFWGAEKMEGIVVGCSGVQPWFDKMICRLVLAYLIAMARNEFEKYHAAYPKDDFLPKKSAIRRPYHIL